MNTRMFRWTAVSVLIVAGLTTCARAQYLYVGPGSVVQSQIYGPFVYDLYGYLGPGPYLRHPYPVPRTYVPAPGPYLYGPVIVPPAYGYPPTLYQPNVPAPYVPPAQQAPRGYQPKPNRPRFADPYARRRGLSRSAKPVSPYNGGTADQQATTLDQDSTTPLPSPGDTAARERTDEPKPQGHDAPPPGDPAVEPNSPAPEPQDAPAPPGQEELGD